MRTTTWMLSMLFGMGQPYSEALTVPCDILLELIESKMDEGLSHLEKDGPRLARKQIAAAKSHGSVPAFVKAAMEDENKPPGGILPASLPKP